MHMADALLAPAVAAIPFLTLFFIDVLLFLMYPLGKPFVLFLRDRARVTQLFQAKFFGGWRRRGLGRNGLRRTFSGDG